MALGVGIGHNRQDNNRTYAIVFDFDTELLKLNYPGPGWNIAYDNVKRYLTVRGFSWMQGSTYFGDDSVDAVRCVRIVQELPKKYEWFTPSVRDIRMLRIEENNDLTTALDDDDD